MAFRNPYEWVKSVAHDNSNASLLGFRYNPGSYMQSNGVVAEYFQLPPREWVRLRRDAAREAVTKFGNAVEHSRDKPAEVA